jgi:hypothetical protein
LRVVALDRILEAERGLIDRARLLLDIAKLLCMVSAHQRAAPPKPRGGQWRWRGQRSEPVWEGSASVSTIHAPFPTEVECKMHGHSPENFRSHDPP